MDKPQCKVIEVELECEVYQVKEVMRAVLHTILFHRCLIQTMPINVDLKVAKCDVASMETDVEHAIGQLHDLLDVPSPTPQTVDMVFFEKKERKSWFFKAPHENPWERWRVKIKPHFPSSSTDPEERERFLRYLERQLRSTLLYISTEALEGAEGIPPLTASPKAYPYRIQVHNGTPESLVGILRRMVTDTSNAPPLLG